MGKLVCLFSSCSFLLCVVVDFKMGSRIYGETSCTVDRSPVYCGLDDFRAKRVRRKQAYKWVQHGTVDCRLD